MENNDNESKLFNWPFTKNSDLNYELLESPHFKFYRQEACVWRQLKRTNTNECVQFGFRSLIPNGRLVFHKTSLIDDRENEHFTSSGILFSHTDNTLMIISYQDYFLPQIQNGLIFRFMWFEKEECPPYINSFLLTESPVSDCDRETQTDAMQSLPTKDYIIINGSSVQICESSIETDKIHLLSTRCSSTDTESLVLVCDRGIQGEIIPSPPKTDIATSTENLVPVCDRGIQSEIMPSPPKRDSSTSTDEEQNALLNILSDQLGCFYESNTNTDCVLQVGESKFPVHRSMLSARSAVFAAMFLHDTSESQNGIVNILHVDSDVIDDVLYYIYSGKIRGLSPDTAVSMFEMADKYALIELKEKCLNFLKQNITMQNVCEVALMAHIHSQIELQKNVVLFIEMRLQELIQTDNWRKFSNTHPKIANYLICSAFKVCKSRNHD